MSTYGEPPNGDFVAYVEELQRESAARLQSHSKAPLLPHDPGELHSGHPTGMAAESPALTRRQADELLERFASHRATAHQVGPAIGLVFGVALSLSWLLGGSNLLALLFGVGLMAWSIRHLRRAAAQRASAPRAGAHAIVSQFFGKPPRA